MQAHNTAPPSHAARGWLLLWLIAVVVILMGCGGSSYAKSAHPSSAPMAPEADYAPGGVTAAAAAPADDGDYDFEAEEAQMESYDLREEAPMPAPAPPRARTAQVSQPAGGKAPETEPEPASSGDVHGTKPTEPAMASDAVPIQQVLIYTAQLRMAVFEVDKALDDVEALARSLGGFLSRRTDTEITIRVPAAQFDDALQGIASKGDVLTRNVQVEDVTEEYLDVMLRLKNARQVRERIAQLLENAKNVEESLEVERELNRLSSEIERLEGRLKYLRNRARYSTITVTFQPQRGDEVTNPAFRLPFPWLRELGLGRLMNLR